MKSSLVSQVCMISIGEEFNFLNVSLYVCMGGERLGADQNKIYIFFLLFYQQNLNFYIYIIGFLYKSCIHILIG